MAAIAPMDLVVKSDPASIPLRCTLCPKKPNYSDVSHLLTHISSKGHLSHRFKAELRSHSEREAQEAIRQYDDWYERHGIRALLAERMAAKDQKKTGKRGRPTHSDTVANKPRIVPARSDAIKPEPEDFVSATPSIVRWAAHSHTSAHAHNAPRGYFDNSGYQTPTFKRSLSDFSMSTPDNSSNLNYRRWPSETETTESIPTSDIQIDSPAAGKGEGDGGEMSKLKGVKYPGMGLFDAASEQARRRRNQRKDASVLRQMEHTSSIIQPTEVVWTENGEFERTRDIYASPSPEGSPARSFERDEQQNRKKRARRALPTSTPTNRPTRSSARIAKQKTEVKHLDDDDGDFIDDGGALMADRKPSLGHASFERFDVFQARSKQNRDRSASPLRHRSALNSLNSNAAMMQELSKPPKPLSYYSGDNNNNAQALSSHPPLSSNPYCQQQTIGSYNPLYVQTRHGYFHPYSYASYGTDPRYSTPNMQGIPSMQAVPSMQNIPNMQNIANMQNTNNPGNQTLGSLRHPDFSSFDEFARQRGNGGFDI